MFLWVVRSYDLLIPGLKQRQGWGGDGDGLGVGVAGEEGVSIGPILGFFHVILCSRPVWTKLGLKGLVFLGNSRDMLEFRWAREGNCRME